MIELRDKGMEEQAGRVHNATSRFILMFESFYGLEGRRSLSSTYRMSQMNNLRLPVWTRTGRG